MEELSREVIGKEGDVLTRGRDDARTAFTNREIERLVTRGDPWEEIAMPALRLLPISTVASQCRVAPRTVKRWRTGVTRPEDEARVTQRIAYEANCFLAAVGEPEGDVVRDAHTVLWRFIVAEERDRQRLAGRISAGVACLGMRGLVQAIGVPYETVRSWYHHGPRVSSSRLLGMRETLEQYTVSMREDDR
ncbi:MAG: hypothetical protein M3P51_18340 [Chloroflexota bacterium]|nr:hypothetical protein [Chloroflexota bacterium]